MLESRSVSDQRRLPEFEPDFPELAGPTVQSIFFPYAPVTYTVLAQEPSPSPSADPSPSPSEEPDVCAEREEAPAAQPEVEAAAFTG